MDGPLFEKSLDFGTRIVILFEEYSRAMRDVTIVRQLLRSGTSIGANIHEAAYGSSKADFIAKLQIAAKECNESIYWLTILDRTQIFPYDYKSLLRLANEIRRMLSASLQTAKKDDTAEYNNHFPEGKMFRHSSLRSKREAV